MMTFTVAAVVLVGAWVTWCAVAARRDGPGPAALIGVPPIILVLLVVQAGSAISLASIWGEQATAGEVHRAVVVSAAAGFAATAAVAGLAVWVRRADGADTRSHSLLLGTAVAVALWSGSCSGMLAA